MKINLRNLSDATSQQVFDQVATHLLKQNERCLSVDDSGDECCTYHSAKGLKCAAGCLIDSEEYTTNMEGNRWSDLIGRTYTIINSINANEFIRFTVPNTHENLIYSLQCIHDSIPPNLWRGRLYELAEEFALDAIILDNL